MASYEKIYVSPVLAITNELGLIVEVTKGNTNNVLSLWQQYKDEDGKWQYTGTKNGAKNIRIPLNSLVTQFILDEVQKVHTLSAKIEEVAKQKKEKPQAKEELKPGVLPDLDNVEIIANLANFLNDDQLELINALAKKKTTTTKRRNSKK